MSDYNKQSNSYSKNDRNRNNNGNNRGGHGHNNGNNNGNNRGGNAGNRNNQQGKHKPQNPQPKPFKDNSGEPPISTFMLGEKELEGKMNQFHYDKGNYSIVEIEGEEKNVVYKSRNSQEAYQKWNVLIGRKKERMSRADREKEQKEQQA